MEGSRAAGKIARFARIECVAKISRPIYDVRQQAGLTQQGLAELVGTTQSAISRLEDADYGGHSLSMLQRIAIALNQKVEIRFSPLQDMVGT